MASSPTFLHADYDDDMDWDAAVKEIDKACEAVAAGKLPASVSNLNSNFNCNHPQNCSGPSEELQRKGKIDVNYSSLSSTRQSTLDNFIGVSSGNSKKFLGKVESSNGLARNNGSGGYAVCENGGGVAECEYAEMVNRCVAIDPEAAKTWIYPVNIPRRDYQFSITKTALFSNTLVVLPTGLGKTLIAAVVMYNYFRWFPEGKIVFAAPSRPLVLQQIEACHNIVGIPQEWTIDLTGQTNPKRRADLWKDRRVFFVTPQVLEKDIHSGSCLVKHLVCLVVDEAHRATGNYSYCVAVRELMDVPVELRILALTATPGSKHLTIQNVIDNLCISTLEYRSESDPDVLPYVNDRKMELIQVAMGNEAVEVDNLIMEVARPFIARLSAYGVMQKRDFQTFSPPELLNSRDKFRDVPPQDIPVTKYGEVEGYFGVLLTLCHVRRLLSSHGIRPAFEMLEEKLKQGSFARLVSRNEILLKAKLLMQQTISHGAPSPKLAKMLEVLTDHFKANDPRSSRVIIFSNFRGSVRDILNALTNIGEFVKATEFIGQSSGINSKGQSQKVQQAVLQKFRTGGYNVIVSTSIGEEGLDIMEVDLVICFDANISPLRMIQRMGRTGRKHKGRVDILFSPVSGCSDSFDFFYKHICRNITIAPYIGDSTDLRLFNIIQYGCTSLASLLVLACEGSEMKGYMRKQAKGNTIKKHMNNGGRSSFNFHPSPRMVPHVFRPEVQYLEMSIEKFIPRGKKIRDCDPVPMSPYKNRLTDAESSLLSKYFAPGLESSWRPSLIAFPHFQAFPSPVDKIVHSSRTGMLIDTMQLLQGVPCSKDDKALISEDEDIIDPFFRVEAEESREKLMEEKSADLADAELKKEVEDDVEVEGFAKDTCIKDFKKLELCVHKPLFGSEFVSVDDAGNVLVSSLPQLPLSSIGKHTENSNSIAFVCHSKRYQSRDERIVQKDELFFGEDEILVSPVSSRKPNEMEMSDDDHNLVHEPSGDFRDFELSPRLTNFIESGVVPESPVISTGTQNHDEKMIEDGGPGKMDVQLPSDINNDMQTPVLHKSSSPSVRTSPVQFGLEKQSPFATVSSTSGSKEWLLDSEVKPQSVEQPRKLRRLRKLGDHELKFPLRSEEQTDLKRKLQTSKGVDKQVPTKLVKGKKKRATDAAVYIEEEAEVSSESAASDNEEDEQDDSSYEDSFIDDGVNMTSVSTQAGTSRPDMMGIYRRSLLSQSPFQMLPTSYSPDSVVPNGRLDENGSSSGQKDETTPQTGLQSTARIACNENNGTSLDSRKRKLSHYQVQSVPVVNLDTEFSTLSKNEGKENSSMQIQKVNRTEDNNNNIDIFDDDGFYDGLDLDAIEAEAAKLLGFKSECLNPKAKTVNTVEVEHNLAALGSPSFDLGI
ncbi:ATP-dependent DNA helicase MPH1 [Striga asiatica]|uniref:ATP-dependent DNA helicase MPH1 n=1 Tax=Striga asiatica TaxID=4170 RepID=A0A5A7PY80_STRAF|nr:ATP-dependent DNA helicase MPH1 [Striga asiatica]